MAIPYNIPLPAVLPDTVASAYDTRFDQITRLLFQMPGQPFADAAAIKLKANWDALLIETDATKVVGSPIFSDSKIENSKPLEQGPDTNTTFRGLPEFYSKGTAMFNATFRGKDAISMKSLDALTQFSNQDSLGASHLGVYMINKDGHIICLSDFSAIPIYAFNVSSVGTQGLNSANTCMIQFALPPFWDNNDETVAIFVPGFDPNILA